MVGEGVWRQGGKDEYCFLFCPKWIKMNFSCRALLLHVFTFCPLWQASMHANKFFANTLPFSSHSGGVCSCFFANTAVVFPPIAGVPVVVVLFFLQILLSFFFRSGFASCFLFLATAGLILLPLWGRLLLLLEVSRDTFCSRFVPWRRATNCTTSKKPPFPSLLILSVC